MTVTKADPNYVGSVTIDRALLEASGILRFQKVHINNLSNGMHWETYALPGKRGRGEVCLNGPPARHFQPGDIVIIVAYVMIDRSEYRDLKPVIVFVDDKNRIKRVAKHIAIPIGSTGL